MTTLRTRRHFLRASSVALACTAVLVLCGASAAQNSIGAADRSVVRLLTVGTVLTDDPVNGVNVLDGIVAEFEAQTGYEVVVTQAGVDIFERARVGGADIVMAHLGFTELQDFVSEGAGQWPATILSNSVALLVPPGDPAGVGSAADPYEAFEAIAALEVPFVVNNLLETRYITDTLYEAAGRPDEGDWFIDLGQNGPPALREAARRGGYTLWGLHPFLMLQRSPQPVALEPVLFSDSIMQQLLATVVVGRPPGLLNREGANAFQQYLISPATQAQIRAFHLPGIDGQIFWPAGNENAD